MAAVHVLAPQCSQRATESDVTYMRELQIPTLCRSWCLVSESWTQIGLNVSPFKAEATLCHFKSLFFLRFLLTGSTVLCDGRKIAHDHPLVPSLRLRRPSVSENGWTANFQIPNCQLVNIRKVITRKVDVWQAGENQLSLQLTDKKPGCEIATADAPTRASACRRKPPEYHCNPGPQLQETSSA